MFLRGFSDHRDQLFCLSELKSFPSFTDKVCDVQLPIEKIFSNRDLIQSIDPDGLNIREKNLHRKSFLEGRKYAMISLACVAGFPTQ